MASIGHQVLTTQHVDDTMAWARSLLPLASDGTVLIARNITKARGRQGRSWVLAEGQITQTIILKPNQGSISQESLPLLTMALSLGLWEPFQPYGALIKWPNDLVLNDKKLGGMLLESIWHESSFVGLILGYSININNTCSEHETLQAIATSLSDATERQHDLGMLQENLFKSLSNFYDQWKNGNYQDIFRLWRQKQAYLGKNITVHHKDGLIVEGTAQDLLFNGDLVMYIPFADRTEVVSFAQIEAILVA